MGDTLIDKLHEWFLDEDTGIELFVEQFARAHKDVFDLDQEEHKQEYMVVFQDFQSRFEGKLNAFLQEQGITQEAFLTECKKRHNSEEAGVDIVGLILSTLEYETFVSMIRDAQSRSAE